MPPTLFHRLKRIFNTLNSGTISFAKGVARCGAALSPE
jgi:hypothetical protein